MFSAAKQHALNATLCFPSSKISTKKNHVVEYMDAMDGQNIKKMATWQGKK